MEAPQRVFAPGAGAAPPAPTGAVGLVAALGILPNLTPYIAAIPQQNAIVDEIFSIVLPLSSIGVAPFTYSLTGLPLGLGFTPSIRTVLRIPEAPGQSTLQYTVRDFRGATGTRSFTINVTGSPLSDVVIEQSDTLELDQLLSQWNIEFARTSMSCSADWSRSPTPTSPNRCAAPSSCGPCVAQHAHGRR